MQDRTYTIEHKESAATKHDTMISTRALSCYTSASLPQYTN